MTFDPIGPSSRAVGPVDHDRGPRYGPVMDQSASPAAIRDRTPSTAGDDVFAARARTLATRISIRRILPTDSAPLQAFYGGLSDESRRTRFLGSTNGIGGNQSAYFCAPDHAHREGFVAVMGPVRGPTRIVGHLCIEPDGPARAEVAVAVANELLGRGIGRRLVDAAVAWARRDGLRTLTATMLADNPAIQRLLTGLGLPTVAVPIGAGVVEIRIELDAGLTAA
jgi:GNAT superfamily N-acetyltransferase